MSKLIAIHDNKGLTIGYHFDCPSLGCGGGHYLFSSDCTHEFAGQTVDIPEQEE